MEEKQKKMPNKFWTKLKSGVVKAGHFGLDLLFPQDMKCIFCGRDVPDFEDKPYCKDCEKGGVLNDGKRCRICDVPVHDARDICEFCDGDNRKKHYPPQFDKAFCPFLYNDLTKPAILRLKEDNGKFLVKTFAKFMANRVKEEGVTIDVIIPVPSHPKTVKRRGYNQAELLAKDMAKILNAEVNTTCVTKVKESKQQKKLSFRDRQANVYNTLSFQNLDMLKDKNILIVDDVLTTCATVNAIAKGIKKYAHNIYVSTIARRDLQDSHKDEKINLWEILKNLFKKDKK